MQSEKAKPTNQPFVDLGIYLNYPIEQPREGGQKWTRGLCPNCGYARADVDQEGILWCPACGYSKKGCYT